MSRPRLWVLVGRKVTDDGRAKFLTAQGRLVTQRGRALNLPEVDARKLAELLESTHASYEFKVKPWGRVI